jgi:hypothetical protein
MPFPIQIDEEQNVAIRTEVAERLRTMKACVLWLAGSGYVRAPLGAANLYASANATT